MWCGTGVITHSQLLTRVELSTVAV